MSCCEESGKTAFRPALIKKLRVRLRVSALNIGNNNRRPPKSLRRLYSRRPAAMQLFTTSTDINMWIFATKAKKWRSEMDDGRQQMTTLGALAFVLGLAAAP